MPAVPDPAPAPAPAPAPVLTVTNNPDGGLTATTGTLNWPAILKAVLAAILAALGG